MTWYRNIPIKNIYLLFYYAMCGLGMRPYKFDRIKEDEDFENVEDALAAILGVGIGWQLKQGLYREYIDRTEDLPTIRGKIDITGTIRNRIAHRQLISCEYDDLSENNLGNQILKTTVMLLLREKNVKKGRKNALRRGMRYFSNVEEIRDLTSIPWSKLRFHRGNQIYQTLLFFCQMVLDRNLLNNEGGRKLKSFLNEDLIPKIYEKFILGYYDRTFKDKLDVGARKVTWALDEEGKKKEDKKLLPDMHSDITLSYPKDGTPSKVLIIDAKCYKKILQGEKTVTKDKEDEDATGDEKGNKDRIRSAHLYQIFTYVKNKEVALSREGNGEKKNNVSGMLLYAQTYKKGEDGKPVELTTKGPDPYNIGGPYNMCGNKISVRALDLSKDFSHISGQLDKIANDFLSSEAEQQG